MFLQDLNIKKWIKDRTFAEIVSTLSALIFVVSAGINGVVFWLNFNINYFAIATPSDIIMSSFVTFSILVCVAIISVSIGAFIHFTILPIIVKNLYLRFVLSSFFTLAFLIILVFIVIFSTVSARAETVAGPGPGAVIEEWIKYKYDDPFSTKMMLAKSNSLFQMCGHAPVLWIGERSILINCRGMLYLLNNVQDFQMMHRTFALRDTGVDYQNY